MVLSWNIIASFQAPKTTEIFTTWIGSCLKLEEEGKIAAMKMNSD